MPKPNTKTWFTLTSLPESIKVWIHGIIGDWDISSIDLITQLKLADEKDVELKVMSDGGSVYHGYAMYNAIKAHKGQVTAVVDGIAASIASYIVMAADKVQMPKNAMVMIHNPTMGAWGEEKDIAEALQQLKAAKQTVAEAYTEKSNGKKTLDDFITAMEETKWFTAEDALEWGLIDEVVDPVDLTNCAGYLKTDGVLMSCASEAIKAQFTVMPKPEPKDAPTHQPSPPDPNTHTMTQVTDDMPKPTDENTLQDAVKKENARQSAIRALCAQHKISDEQRDEMLNDLNCDEAGAAQTILINLGAASAAGTPSHLMPAHLNIDNGAVTKDALQNALNARCGVAKADKDNPYKLKTLLDMAEIAVGKDARMCGSKSELVARAFNTGDFAEIITESIRTVMREEAKIRAPLWRDLASTENLPDFRETELAMINDAPDLMAVSEDGEYKQAIIKGTGEKIQLATFGREIGITRHAIINDEIGLLAKIPRKFMQAGYRLSDKLMFAAIFSSQMADGKDVFVKSVNKGWGNLFESVTASDYSALIMALHKSFATATTSGGDALDLRGQVLLANPDHASYLEAVLNTASKPDTFNPAYKKFGKVIETARMNDINGAIALTGKDFESVVMGFLDGQQDPWLETGDGFTSDGAKFRITYDLTSKVLDRRGIAKATFKAN
ncbi:Clp protease ClpP [Photobacterium frigidiphilum]|uniref:ClpP-like prohead protease/major capsid protein fusion protein n=1 Tax=Photobacterium frigidiphilum TaxID=264736 RepID=UPI003D0DC5F9